jgi:hypothetical protein
MLYLVDANVVIAAKDTYYAVDQVPEFWSWIIHESKNGNIKIPFEILEEISPGNDEKHPFYAWRKDKKHVEALQLDGEVDKVTLQQVIEQGYAPDLTDDELLAIGKDPFIIAYALMEKERSVVTIEVSAPAKTRKNRRIPDVCAQFGVRCINTFQMTRELGFSTRWNG